MAEASLISIAESLLTKLGSYASKKIISCWEAKGDLQKLVSTIEFIKAGLLDAEKRQNEGELIKLWLQRLRNVLYDADDLFDKVFTIEESKQILSGKEKFMGELSQFFSKSNHIALRAEIARKVKQIREELDDIKSDMGHFAFNRSLSENETFCERETGSLKLVDDIIGREEDERKLVQLLLDHTSKGEGTSFVDVIAIVGFGGLGKTTLAQLLYNNKVVRQNFEYRAWACVSDTKGKTRKAGIILDALQTTEIIGSSEKSSNCRNVRDISVDELEHEIHARTQNKKYLLVLDDFWDEDPNTWLYLKGLLREGKMGSKILVTTRSLEVAHAIGIESPYDIKGLADDKAWELFKTLAFSSKADAVDQDLINMGKEIVRKCRNVPLAIKAIASLLYASRDKKRTWKMVMQSDMLTLEKHHNLNVLAVLKLSYDHLPSHLKHCFAYCSVFPKDFKMDGEKLIYYWIAQGYVDQQGYDGGQYGLMQIGETYLKELVSRSFLQQDDTNTDEFRRYSIYKMHDLMHDLAQDMAGEEILCVESSEDWPHIMGRTGQAKGNNPISKDVRVRHLGLFDARSGSDILPLKRANYLRSFIIRSWISRKGFGKLSHLRLFGMDITSMCSSISKLKHLRLLCMSSMDIRSLCSSIGELKHLRGLVISRNRFNELPDDICKLHNLKILDVSYCGRLKSLPRNMGRLINLTCLRVDKCGWLRYMPCEIGALSSLESLDSFSIAESSTEYSGWEALARLVNFKDDSLVVSFGKNASGVVREEDDQKRVDLSSSLVHLACLVLSYAVLELAEYDKEREILCSQLPSNLKRLVIKEFPGQKLPEWKAFNTLVDVYLYRCRTCCYLPSFGLHPRLMSLRLNDLHELEYVQMEEDEEFAAETHYFPCLERLRLESLPKLKAWSPGMERLAQRCASSPSPAIVAAFPRFHSLTFLELHDCPELMSMPLPPNGMVYTLTQDSQVKEPLRKLLSHETIEG